MIKVIETNLLFRADQIADHQSRVIEVESWNEYLKEIQDAKPVMYESMFSCLNGSTLPSSNCKILDFISNEYTASCTVIDNRGKVSKKLMYRIG